MDYAEEQHLKPKLRIQIALKWKVFDYKHHMNGLVFKYVHIISQTK